jgi:hypothetical protein
MPPSSGRYVLGSRRPTNPWKKKADAQDACEFASGFRNESLLIFISFYNLDFSSLV